MSQRVACRTILKFGTACCLVLVSIGCTPPEPQDLREPVLPGSTAEWISPAVTSVSAIPTVKERDMNDSVEEGRQFPVRKTTAEWQSLLTPEQFRITRMKGTERAFTGMYWNTETPGTYHCVCCGQALFLSDGKFKSGCGWPSFFQAVDDKAITTQPDNSIPPPRVEIMCSNCGAHLGHVFEDGPLPTGLRYCVNSASVKLVESESEQDEAQK